MLVCGTGVFLPDIETEKIHYQISTTMFRISIRRSSSVSLSRKFDVAPNSRIFSLIQPTGKIHLGNYLGAICNWKDISETSSEGSQYIYGIADLHSLTLPYDPKQLKVLRYEAIASLIASGVDPDRCILFHQSAVPEHSELMWILTCLTSMGALNRMTQWKLKAKIESGTVSEQSFGQTKAGLLNYPILQAADILIYRSTHVPVGEDQSQHIELCRDIAQTFNSTYNTEFFPLPKTLLTPTKKILSLRNPAKKMSKSDKDQSASVYVTEDEASISKKIRRATTDSIQSIYFDPENRPGVSNLINIVSGLTRKSIEDTVKEIDWIKNHKQLKDHVTELIIEEFKPKRHLYDELMKDVGHLEKVCNLGREKASAIARKNINEVKAIAGLD